MIKIVYFNKYFTGDCENTIHSLNKSKEENLSNLEMLKERIIKEHQDLINKILDLQKSKADYIGLLKNESDNIIKLMKDIKNDNYKDSKSSNVEISCKNLLDYVDKELAVLKSKTPFYKFNYDYIMNEYSIAGYRDKLIIKDPIQIMSPYFKMGAFEWSLICNPLGEYDDTNNFVGLFVALKDIPGASFKIKYKTKIKIINQKGKADYEVKNTEEYTNYNLIHGVETFYFLSDIDKDGFIAEDGSMKVQIFIKPDNEEEFEKENWLSLSL